MWSRQAPGWPDSPPLPGPRLVLEVDGALADQLLRAAQAQDLPAEILANDLLMQAVEQESLRLRAEAALTRLTPREREVARWVVLVTPTGGSPPRSSSRPRRSRPTSATRWRSWACAVRPSCACA